MKKIFTLMMMLVASLSIQAQEDTWTVAGTSPICGVSWSPAATQNDMTKQLDGTYKLVKEGCTLEQGVKFEFKVCKNHTWAEAYPSNNYTFYVDETGTYDVTITFNPTTKDVGHSATKTGGAIIGDKTWTVAGDEKLMGTGSHWKVDDTSHDMTKQADGSYILELTNVALEAEEEYEYKICANHGWDESYGNAGGDGNAFLQVSDDGIYNVKFVFNPTTTPKTVNAIATFVTGISDVKTDATNSKITSVYNLNGQRVSGSSRGVMIQNGKKVLK